MPCTGNSPVDPEPPKWLDHLSQLIANGASPKLEGQSPGGLLWIPRGDKNFVFTFGYGHTKIKDEWVEPDFGKIVALSVIPQGQVKEVRAEQVFAKRHVASERAPTASAVQAFGFESDRDLVAAVEGVPERIYSAAFGVKVRGGVSFKFELEVANLIPTLDQIISRFDSDDHLRRWPQASNLVPVRDTDQINQLDALLHGLLIAPNPGQTIALTAPAEKSGDKPYPKNFFLGRRSTTPVTTPYLTFAGWEMHLRALGTPLGLAAANATRVHASS